MKALRHFYALSLIFIFAQAINAQGPCSLPMDGYTKLGEFEGHGYYLSTNQTHWIDAKAAAESNGYSLVSINSQDENDFIHGLVSEMVFIGLTDKETEGTPYWVNGDELVYTNYSDCDWCGENDAIHNYGVMFPWDGKWFLDHYFRTAKHIVEISCQDISSELVLTCPENIWMELPAGSGSVVATWEDAVGATDCTISTTVDVTQVAGEVSGSSFNLGTHVIGYQAVDECGSFAECVFDVTVSMPVETGCGEIDGYTYFGNFEGHGYYMSDEASTWADAKDFAQAAGGYLAAVSSKDENDFIQVHLGQNMVFIGYTDATVEGEGAWSNGEDVSIDLSYGNDDGSDFGIMNFWNGHWVMVNQFVYKRYILEVDCGGTPPTDVTMTCPSDILVTIPEGEVDVVATWDDPITTTNCDIDQVVTLTQTAGPLSGTAFIQGDHLISYSAADNCGNVALCSFTVKVDAAGAVCGPIAGYTSLGQYNGHMYYLSEGVQKWVDAKYTAAADGGHLAVIGTQEENDFLQGAIGNEQAFIGYADDVTEATSYWANGDDITLDLSYGNTEENDFAVINFWAGTWQLVNQWVARKYILEVDCNAANAGNVAPTPVASNPIVTSSIYDVYPNPANDLITARLLIDESMEIGFTIYDARGQVFLTENVMVEKGAIEKGFDISNLPAGMYFLQMGQGGTYKRFVKMD